MSSKHLPATVKLANEPPTSPCFVRASEPPHAMQQAHSAPSVSTGTHAIPVSSSPHALSVPCRPAAAPTPSQAESRAKFKTDLNCTLPPLATAFVSRSKSPPPTAPCYSKLNLAFKHLTAGRRLALPRTSSAGGLGPRTQRRFPSAPATSTSPHALFVCVPPPPPPQAESSKVKPCLSILPLSAARLKNPRPSPFPLSFRLARTPPDFVTLPTAAAVVSELNQGFDLKFLPQPLRPTSYLHPCAPITRSTNLAAAIDVDVTKDYR
ncbi:hypothetical protein R3P38DRAFT_3183164 [Favolaschia claudopus]|uniref:Uncharacterized protein n=1 Tax=Favolaschia claudopus TaxID=2862362 RepID=A0AAW0CDQ4_9AGAR